MWARAPTPYRRKLVYTDEYEVYARVLHPWQHRTGPSPKGSGRTSVVEGINNKCRRRVSGLVRKSVGVRYEADLERRLTLVFEEHNRYCRREVQTRGWL